MRKYIQGNKLRSLDYILKQDHIFIDCKVQNMEWARNYQAQYLQMLASQGRIRKAIRVTKYIEGCSYVDTKKYTNACAMLERCGFKLSETGDRWIPVINYERRA